MAYEKEEPCNLVLYTREKAKKSAYDKLMDHAKEVANGISDADAWRLKANPTKEMLKSIMEKNDAK